MVLNSRVLFVESIKSEKTLIAYTWRIQKFVDYYKLKDFDSILKIPKEELARPDLYAKKSNNQLLAVFC